jgi:hypothetical protein
MSSLYRTLHFTYPLQDILSTHIMEIICITFVAYVYYTSWIHAMCTRQFIAIVTRNYLTS